MAVNEGLRGAATGLATGLVAQYERSNDLDALADELALYTGMEHRFVRGCLLDALRDEAEGLLREAEER